jgi:hypothetical protein
MDALEKWLSYWWAALFGSKRRWDVWQNLGDKNDNLNILL